MVFFFNLFSVFVGVSFSVVFGYGFFLFINLVFNVDYICDLIIFGFNSVDFI